MKKESLNTVWITGAKGMLGSCVRDVLDCVNTVLISTDNELDIADFDALKNFTEGKSIDWIVNCAAYTAVDLAEDEEEKAFGINGTGAGNLALIAEIKGAKIIHLSTDYVFDGLNNKPYKEDDEVSPVSVYGMSKLEGERRVSNNCDRYFIIRIAWLYGKSGGNFAATMLKLMNERESISVVCDQTGTPTYACDTAEIIKKIIFEDRTEYGIYNFTNGGETTWYDYAIEIYRLSQKLGLVKDHVRIKPVTASDYPTKAKRPENSVLCSEKIKAVFNIDIREWKYALAEFLQNIDPGYIRLR